MSRLATIDCDYVMPRLAAAFLRESKGEVAFIETNTTYAVPHLMEALHKEALDPKSVKYVIVTHVHLDHAGGASALMKLCPNATLLAHPRAARHLIDPSKLVASARQVYGVEVFDKLYGDIEPIDEKRVQQLDDGATVTLGASTLSFLHTRGHANHHFVVHDSEENVTFTGDTFGLVYPALQRAKRFAYPSTSPTDFDGEAAIASVKRVMDLKPRAVGLTHFGLFEEVTDIGAQLIRWLELSTKMVADAAKSGDEQGTIEQRFKWELDKEFEKAAVAAGLTVSDDDRQLMRFDLELNAQGLAVAAVRQRPR
ncbi:MAG: MBL fold metallo-hydrolase [Archangium sp.]|nr:MBL fold metallo-hydrolase [Archangium sp.]